MTTNRGNRRAFVVSRNSKWNTVSPKKQSTYANTYTVLLCDVVLWYQTCPKTEGRTIVMCYEKSLYSPILCCRSQKAFGYQLPLSRDDFLKGGGKSEKFCCVSERVFFVNTFGARSFELVIKCQKYFVTRPVFRNWPAEKEYHYRRHLAGKNVNGIYSISNLSTIIARSLERAITKNFFGFSSNFFLFTVKHFDN